MDLYKEDDCEIGIEVKNGYESNDVEAQKINDYIQSIAENMISNKISAVRNNLTDIVLYFEMLAKQHDLSDLNIHIEPNLIIQIISLLQNPSSIEPNIIFESLSLVIDHCDDITKTIFSDLVLCSEFLSERDVTPSQNYLELAFFGHILKNAHITSPKFDLDELIAKVNSSELVGEGFKDAIYPIQFLVEQSCEPEHGKALYDLLIHSYFWFKSSNNDELPICINELNKKGIFPSEFNELVTLINDDLKNKDFQISIETARVLISIDPTITITLRSISEVILYPTKHLKENDDVVNIQVISGFVRSYTTLNRNAVLMLNSLYFPRLAIKCISEMNVVTRYNFHVIILNCICELGWKKIIKLDAEMNEILHITIIDFIRNTFEFENKCALEAGMYALLHIFRSINSTNYLEVYEDHFEHAFPDSDFDDLTEGFYPEIDEMAQAFKNEFLLTTDDQ